MSVLRRLLLACLFAIMANVLLPASAQAQSCAPATTQGTAPADFRTYCWFDFSTYNDATARSAGGQPFTFNLPDGTTVKFTVKASGGSPALTAVAVPSWTGSAFGNSAFSGIPGKPILYTAVNTSTITVTLSAITVTPPTGGTSTYSVIVGDGESTNNNESLSFTTNGNAWTQVAQIPNGSSNLYPTLATSNAGKTVTETGVAGTVGSFVWRSDGNPTTVSSVLKAGGLQGIIVGMRYASISVVSQIANMRYNPADQFTYAVKTSNGTTLGTAGTTSGTALSGFTPSAVPTVAASYPFTVTQALAAGSVGTAANYTTTLTCTNTNSGSTTAMPSNVATSSYTFNSLAYNDAVLCTFTNTPIFNKLTGTVYSDANHNGAQDGAESGTGVSGLYVKVATVSGGVCAAGASQAVPVDPATGAYTVPNLAQGTYCVILDDNNTLADVTPTAPSGWLPTQNASGMTQIYVPAGSPPPVPQNFGLFNGSRVAGTVFADTGLGGGGANNGLKDGTEGGLGSITVRALAGSTAVATAITAGDGTFTLWVPAGATGTITVAPTAPSGYVATGGSAGTTGGSYVRPNVTYTAASGQSWSGVLFGLVPPATFTPNGAQTAQPGSVVFYAHTFQAGSAGQVSFTLVNSGSGWTAVLYQDTNCSGALDAAEPLVSAPMALTAGQQVCLVVKQFVPAGVASGASSTVAVTAAFSYANANPALNASLVVTDVTTSGEPQALSLTKLVSNVTRGGAAATSVTAAPGEVLQYTLTAHNNGSTSLSNLVVNDATPAFTTYVSAACPPPAALPAGITACTVSAQPGVGNAGGLQWTFAGTLAAGAQVAVTYQVKLSQ